MGAVVFAGLSPLRGTAAAIAALPPGASVSNIASGLAHASFYVRSEAGQPNPKGEQLVLDSFLSLESVVVAAEHQVSCSLGDESAILNMKNNVYYGLDPVGARIWTLLRQPRTIREMCDVIADEYDVERHSCERDILELLETMKGEGLVELSAKVENDQ